MIKEIRLKIKVEYSKNKNNEDTPNHVGGVSQKLQKPTCS